MKKRKLGKRPGKMIQTELEALKTSRRKFLAHNWASNTTKCQAHAHSSLLWFLCHGSHYQCLQSVQVTLGLFPQTKLQGPGYISKLEGGGYGQV